MKIARTYVFIATLLNASLGIYAQQCDQCVTGAIYVKLKTFSNTEEQRDLRIHPEFINPFQQIAAPFGFVRSTSLTNSIPSLKSIYRVEFTATDRINELIAAFEKSGIVDYAEPICTPMTDAIPGDMNPSLMWYLSRINMQESWGFVNTGKKIKVGVIDNGIRISHEDIKDNLWTNPLEIPGNGIDDDGNGKIDDMHGWDVADNDNNPSPPPTATNTFFSHGTMVAGLASASTDNAKGTVSVGLNTEIVAIKAVRNTGNQNEIVYGYEGIVYALEAGVDVINISWSHAIINQTQQEILREALRRKVIIVASAGNNNQSSPQYPAAFPGVLAVGATNNQDLKADFSNYGSWISVMAPGVDLYTTLAGSDQSYGFVQGTSFAAPIVSGLAGFLISQNLEIDRTEIISIIKEGCDNIDNINNGYKGLVGAGRINVDETMRILLLKSSANPVQQSSIHLYPNPSRGKIHFKSTEMNFDSYLLTDLSGKVVSNGEFENEVLDFSTYSLKGTYVLRLFSAKGQAEAILRVVFY